jgi:hypothetical protein
MKKMCNLLQACHARTILKMEDEMPSASLNQKVGKEAGFCQRSLPIIVPISLW